MLDFICQKVLEIKCHFLLESTCRLQLFSGSPKGAEASAAVFSLIETAKSNKLNPYDYIEFILDYLPQQDLVEDPKKLDWFLPWSEEIKEEFEIKAD